MKKLIILFVLTLCFVLTGCNQTASSQGGEPSAPQESQEPSSAVTTPSADKSSQESSDSSGAVTTSPAQKPDELTPSAIEQTATLYIGTKVKGFTEYPMAYEGDLTPEMLIQGIADLTGWNLILAEPVISGKGGMSVCLSKESALFNGPPDPQKEEFFMFGLDDLAETLLDSIQKTLQEGFTLENGDPDTLDIWYYMEGEQPLELPSLGLSWPLDQPYQWSGAQIMEK